MYEIFGSRLRFREISEQDADLVVRWRNTQLARDSFFSTAVVTPDTHRLFVRNRKPHDLVWMIELHERYNVASACRNPDCEVCAATAQHRDVPVGMTSLTVDTRHHIGEYGRTFIDPARQGQGLATETEYILLSYAFEVLGLKYLWLDAYVSNQAIITLHHKTGWKDEGVDLFGHTNPRGPVLCMTYERADWVAGRARFSEQCHISLEDWQP